MVTGPNCVRSPWRISAWIYESLCRRRHSIEDIVVAHPKIVEHPSTGTLSVTQHRQQQVICAYVPIAERTSFLMRFLDDHPCSISEFHTDRNLSRSCPLETCRPPDGLRADSLYNSTT